MPSTCLAAVMAVSIPVSFLTTGTRLVGSTDAWVSPALVHFAVIAALSALHHHEYLDEVVEWNHLGFDGEEITWQ